MTRFTTEEFEKELDPSFDIRVQICDINLDSLQKGSACGSISSLVYK